MGKTIAILVGADCEDLDVWYPKLRLETAGRRAPLAGLAGVTYRGKHGYPAPAEIALADVDTATLTGVLPPGGWEPERLPRDPAVLDLVRRAHSVRGLVATICHGPWILISARILKGRRMTSSVAIRQVLRRSHGHLAGHPIARRECPRVA